MGFIQSVVNQHKAVIRERNAICDEKISEVNCAIEEISALFSSQNLFIEPQISEIWKEEHRELLDSLKIPEIQQLKKATRFKELVEKKETLFELVMSMPGMIIKNNEYVANRKIETAYELIGDVEDRRLDQQQMACIVKDVHNHLVIAGAGTGKTTTVVGKIKYLIKTEKYLPGDILVLSFTNASATEMRERIAAETGHQIAVSTFHKLGLNIITEVNGVMPRITKINLRKFVKEQLVRNMETEWYLRLLSVYLMNNRVVAKSEFAFHSQSEYDEYLQLNPPVTLANEKVKSYGEMEIANFLAQNGISYIYEHPYEKDTSTDEHGQYYPDFYLPEYKIYIEYFGINKKGEVPPYFKPRKGMSATEAYAESTKWKRQLHRDNQTTMIECYAYEKMEGTLIDALSEKLKNASVKLCPKTAKELWANIANEENTVLDGLVELFETLINLIKSNGYTIEDVRNLNNSGENAKANDQLLTLLAPIFDAYCKHLTAHKEIDFNDMINLAATYVRQGKYINPYKYVIVDEYQDISKARYNLLRSLRLSCDFDLFCVGDDWQSIYRFAGSDIGFILNFPSYWGATTVSKIETTYRFGQKLIEISGDFVMQNPAQVKKRMQGLPADSGFPLGEISGYTETYAIAFLSNKLQDLPKNSSVYFIGRYSFDVNPLANSGLFDCRYNNSTGFVEIKSKIRPDLKIVFLTAHKSKGLQADYVFIINNRKSRMGFPSKIQDSPILELLLEKCDSYPYAEERRLFYVALTRAMKKAFLVTVDGQESVFAQEIKQKYENEIKWERFECPLCGGRLSKKSGPYGEFWGCSNYRTTHCAYKRKVVQQNRRDSMDRES